ncbi:MAG: hypothetical protein GF364_02470, partial [Candidatus Lokiarchaeota archaeon]|nr:hypothetical protein [Candidatus Lokiarchaeota archaeon]
TSGIRYWIKQISLITQDKNFDITLLFWDLGVEVEEEQNIKTDLFLETDGIFVVGDITDKKSFVRIESYWMPKIREYIADDVPMILLANKADLDHELNEEQVEDFRNKLNFYRVFLTSAKTGMNVEEAFKSIILPILKRELSLL